MGAGSLSGTKLVLIDGHSLAFRAFHALPPTMATSRGELTNAVFGFMSMLLNVLRDVQPECLGVAFDVGLTFRHKRFPDYKAQREKMPEELGNQIERIKEILEVFGVPIFTRNEYEADDVLGTLSRQAADEGIETLIVTGDTDAFQLVDDHVRVMTSGRRFSDVKVYDARAVKERYGITPGQLVDYKALVGDKSDNIPGVAGIGEKSATELLQKYETLEGIYAHLDEISNKRVRSALENGREAAFLSQDLARIVRDIDLKLDLETCEIAGYDREKVIDLFRELEFRTLLERLPQTEAAPREVTAGPGTQLTMFAGEKPATVTSIPADDFEYVIIRDQEQLSRLVKQLQEADWIAFDTETTSTRPMEAGLVGISLAAPDVQAAYLPIGHSQGGQLPLERVREQLAPLLEAQGRRKAAHNAIFDLIVLRRHGFAVNGSLFDTMIAEWLIDPSSRNLGLKNLAWTKLGREMTPITDLIGSGKKQGSMADVTIEKAGPYAAADADVTMRLALLLEGELKEKSLWSLFSDIEMPLVPVLADMEMAGVKVDARFLGRMSSELEQRMLELERQIQDSVGYAFNIRSTKQLSDALFIHLGLPAQGRKKTEAGGFSTAAEVLEEMRDAHPVVELVLEHRQIAKLKSTYLDTLPALINPATGRIHTSFNQTGTVTGRVSSSDPNLQNIPIRTPLGRKVREAFVSDTGCRLLSADYSQVELRILAHISGDPALLAAFARGEDIHAFTASSIFQVPLHEVTPDMRRIAKTTNFAIVYGVTGYGLAQQTSLNRQEAEEFIRAYFQQYPRVKAYLDQCKTEAAEQGYVETLLGRRRYFPELQTTQRAHAGLRAAAERMAINMPVQGTAADIIKIAMIRLHAELTKRTLRSRLMLQVHDELLLEVPEEEMDILSSLVKETMENAYELKAPLVADCKAGPNWGEMTPL